MSLIVYSMLRISCLVTTLILLVLVYCRLCDSSTVDVVSMIVFLLIIFLPFLIDCLVCVE
jgi:hypothetical protein